MKTITLFEKFCFLFTKLFCLNPFLIVLISNSYENHVNRYLIKYIDKKCGLLVIS